MDVTTFYALFSATCFTLLGLWWAVVQRHEEWLRDPAQRAVVGGVYLSFLLPALMGLFAQVGGTETPAIWRVSFVAIAVVGGVSTFRLLRRSRARPALQGPLMRHQWTVVVVYALVAVIGAAPDGARAGLGVHGLRGVVLGRGPVLTGQPVSTTSRCVARVIAT